jgi:hypothetical protein
MLVGHRANMRASAQVDVGLSTIHYQTFNSLAPAQDCLRLAAALVLQARLSFAELAGEFAHDHVDGGVEVLGFFVGEDVRAGYGEMHLDPKTVLGLGRLIVNKDDVRRDNLAGEFLQMFDLLRAMPMERGCETKVSGTEVDLHNVKYMTPSSALGNGKRNRGAFGNTLYDGKCAYLKPAILSFRQAPLRSGRRLLLRRLRPEEQAQAV